jgi:hypothetical protein
MQSQTSEHQTGNIDEVADHPIDCPAAITDEALLRAGLVKVSAFMRTKSSVNANRARRAKEKVAKAGAGQLNIVAPLAVHATIKTMSKRLQEGQSLRHVLESQLTAEIEATDPTTALMLMPEARVRLLCRVADRLARLKGWRLLLARLIGIA